MQALAQWLSATPMSLALRELDWLVPLLQTIHILAIAMVVSSVFMIDLRILELARSQSIAECRGSGAGLPSSSLAERCMIVTEPMRALPNPAFQRWRCSPWLCGYMPVSAIAAQ
jgi:hypothetical protein